MSPCDPNSISIDIPDGPSGPVIPGFGIAFNPTLPTINFTLPGPPDLEGLFNLIKMLLPIGNLQTTLNPNFGKDIIDAIIAVLNQFLPFLMLYKFFLPILKLILCVLEVICALPNPVKVIAAVQRLFRECIPLFLSLFPILALLIMILAILLLILQLILYIIMLIIQLIKLILKNIIILKKAIERADAESILAIVAKFIRILCLFQNLFVIFSMILLIIQIFKDILAMLFAIPPCDDSDQSQFQNCCTPDVCPNFVKYSSFIRTTGSFRYISSVNSAPNIDTAALFPGVPAETIAPFLAAISKSSRLQSFQFYDDASAKAPAGEYTTKGIVVDSDAYIYQQFINMVDPKDPNFAKYAALYTLPGMTKPIFFPTDSTYTAKTPVSQAPYTVDIKVMYDPEQWGRTAAESGPKRYITFKDCIVISPTSALLNNADNTTQIKSTGVLSIAGGSAVEEDGTKIIGYDTSAANNYTRLAADAQDNQATIENFLFVKNNSNVVTNIEGIDYINLNNVEYTFKVNNAILAAKGITNYSCSPEVNADRTFTNAAFSNNLNVKLAELKDFQFPDLAKAQQCVFAAIDMFRNNVTEEGAQTLQATSIACMQQLQAETEAAIGKIIPIAFDKYKSTFEVDPSIQFTSKTIKVKVDLKEASGASIVGGLPLTPAADVAKKIVPNITFGDITPFSYDGSRYFVAEISSKIAGSGTIDIAFDNNKISDVNIPSNLSEQSSISIRKLNYEFIYSPANIGTTSVGIGDTSDGQAPRRDDGDISRQNDGGS